MASPSSSSAALRWGLGLFLLVGGIAAVLGLQPHLGLRQGVFSSSSSSSFSPSSSNPRQADDDDRTYCYQAVRTAAALGLNPEKEEDMVNCFSVSPAKGTFTRVFRSNNSEDYEIRRGYVLPGLWDGHGHLLPYGEFLHSADLFGAASPDEVRRRLREYLGRNPGVGTRDAWARGIGWDQMALGEMPTAAGTPFPWGSVWLGWGSWVKRSFFSPLANLSGK
ncbi:uncharacterized protein B0T15DRAFT_194459 [Chaetomium strumarium]|uniref:Amidohydrolase 3 domain-containing protein n=1 Tax=Chaetomium strumarium TaxID=1170767 RepID=A0AAJ0GSJ9_9PEZI|nr:hypothetical protein B0T15DRAFT_194459 [Chaetomium strumarium]